MHQINQILKNHCFSNLADNHTESNVFDDAYATDLISMMIKHANRKPLFITQINADATLGIAILLGLPGIILTEGKVFSSKLIRQANEDNIAVLTTELTAVEVIIELVRMKLL